MTVEPVQVGPLNTTRDFVDVRDVADGLIAIAQSATADDVINVASGIETGTCQVFETFCQLSGRPEPADPSSPPAASTSDDNGWTSLGCAPWG